MATKEVTFCDLCGQEVIGPHHDLQVKRTRKWHSNGFFINLSKDWYTVDICDVCAKEMINYINERRIK